MQYTIDPFNIGAPLKALKKLCIKCDDIKYSWPIENLEPCDSELNSPCQNARTLHREKWITRVSDTPNDIYLVRSGAVKTYYLDNTGSERITGFYLPGDIFGLESFNGHNIPYASKMLRTGQIYRIPYDNIYQLSRKSPSFHNYFNQLMSFEIFDTRRLLILNSHFAADARLAYFILNMSARFKQQKLSSNTFRLPMSRVEISNYLALSPETVSRVLAQFKSKKWIQVQGKVIQILESNKLLTLVTGEKVDNTAKIIIRPSEAA